MHELIKKYKTSVEFSKTGREIIYLNTQILNDRIIKRKFGQFNVSLSRAGKSRVKIFLALINTKILKY